MKKIFIFTVTLLGIQYLTVAQLLKPLPMKKKFEPAKTTTPPPPPSATSVFTLTAVKVTLQTGNDNKEFEAMLNLQLFQRSTNQGIYGLPGNGIKNELPVNSNMEFGLENVGYASSVDKLRLETIQQTGLTLRIYYAPTFFLDAWRIEGVTVTLEFKDQFGNLHPLHGRKTIVFNTAKGILNNTYHTMKCYADGNFTPLTSPISEY